MIGLNEMWRARERATTRMQDPANARAWLEEWGIDPDAVRQFAVDHGYHVDHADEPVANTTVFLTGFFLCLQLLEGRSNL